MNGSLVHLYLNDASPVFNEIDGFEVRWQAIAVTRRSNTKPSLSQDNAQSFVEQTKIFRPGVDRNSARRPDATSHIFESSPGRHILNCN
jgi:hypothetical protein